MCLARARTSYILAASSLGLWNLRYGVRNLVTTLQGVVIGSYVLNRYIKAARYQAEAPASSLCSKSRRNSCIGSLDRWSSPVCVLGTGSDNENQSSSWSFVMWALIVFASFAGNSAGYRSLRCRAIPIGPETVSLLDSFRSAGIYSLSIRSSKRRSGAHTSATTSPPA